jgi:membrane associated rhomboid family serine protease
MIFPYGDDQVRGGHFPLFSYAFIAANIAAFFWQLSDPQGGLYAAEFAAVPASVVRGYRWDTLLTSLFMHGGLMHLLGNMLFLWIFADNIEANIGSIRFLLFYLLGGVVATFAHIALDPFSTIPLLGASGAISAVLGAYLVLYPRSRIKVFLFFLLLIPLRIPALLFLGVWFYLQMSNGLGTLGDQGAGVAWWAHIGGFAFGLLGGVWMRGNFGVKGLHQP